MIQSRRFLAGYNFPDFYYKLVSSTNIQKIVLGAVMVEGGGRDANDLGSGFNLFIILNCFKLDANKRQDFLNSSPFQFRSFKNGCLYGASF